MTAPPAPGEDVRPPAAASAPAPERAPLLAGTPCLPSGGERAGGGRRPPRCILVRLPNWVGDVVMATPALAALRAAHPGAEIVAEGRPFLRELVEGLPTVDRFLPDDGRSALARRRRLAALGADWAVLLPDSARVALGPFLARIPVRVGYARDVVRRLLVTCPLPPPREGGRRLAIPMVQRYLAITRALGVPDPDEPRTALVVDSSARQRVRAMLEGRGVAADTRLAVLTPGASFGSSKLWPPEHFAAAADGLAEQHGLLVVLAPAPGEVELARAIAALCRQPAVVLDDPPTSLAELAALIAGATLVLSNDTGPRHMAVALQVPTVVVMGPTDPRHTAWQLERQRVLREEVDCSPCHQKTCPIDHRCMTRLEPGRVLAAATELLGAGRPGAA